MAEETGVDVETNGNNLHLIFILVHRNIFTHKPNIDTNDSIINIDTNYAVRNERLGGVLLFHSNLAIIVFN